MGRVGRAAGPVGWKRRLLLTTTAVHPISQATPDSFPIEGKQGVAPIFPPLDGEGGREADGWGGSAAFS